ncbi:MAG TPA: TetR/AcrR family transcriptional regulator [Opitutaceae bacterium]
MSKSSASSPTLSKRDQLVETAWRLFYRDGYRAVGIDLILAEAGVAKMTLYNHFASKEDLIVAVLEKRSGDFLESIAAAVEAAGRGPQKRLLAVFDWLGAWLASPDFNGCAFIRAVAEFPDARERPHQVAAAHKQAVVDLLGELAAALEVREPALLARELALLMEGAIVRAHTFGASSSGAAQDARAAARRLIEAALPG